MFKGMAKIAFISSNPDQWWAGCEDLWGETALRFSQAGARVCANIDSRKSGLPEIERLVAAGAKITFRAPDSRYRRLRRRFAPTFFEGKWLQQMAPALVIISEGDSFEASRWVMACAALAKPFVTITHACSPWDWPNDVDYAMFRDAYSKASAAYFVAAENKRLFESKIAARLPRARIVRNPFRIPYDLKLAWPPSRILKIACVAAADLSRKGQDIAVRVLDSEKWRERNVEVNFYCYGGSSAELIENSIESTALPNARVVMNERDLSAIWSQHHALLLPSRREGLPLALVEAMLSARVPIVTDVGGNTEIVKDEVTGFVAKAASDSCLDDALERAWRRRSEWQAIGQEAARAVRSIIPRDPVELFYKELNTVLSGAGSGSNFP
jgi:glycosyltransferase involved in cell wall biosynthesis